MKRPNGAAPARFPSAKAKPVDLIFGNSRYPMNGDHVPIMEVFESQPGDPDSELPNCPGLDRGLVLGAQLGDLIGHLRMRKGRFSVLIYRAIKSRVRRAADLLGRPCQVWDCGPDEDPECDYARAEFWPIESGD